MPVKNKPLTVTYTAIDANGPKTGDGAAQTVRLIRDGVVSVATNAPTEVDAANCPGEYSLALTAAEMNANSVIVCGKSTTSGVQIIPVKIFTDQGLMPGALPGAAGGFVVAGTGVNQLATTGAGLVVTTDSGTITGINTTVTAVRTQTDKMLFTAGNFLKSEVDAYLAGMSPNDQILFTSGAKVRADGTGAVFTTDAPAITAVRGQTDKLQFNAGNLVKSELNAYVTGMAPADTSATVNAIRSQTDKFTFAAGNFVQANVESYTAGASPADLILLPPGNRIGADGTGLVNVGPVALAATGLDAVTLDGRPYNDVIRWIFSALAGDISFDPTTGNGTVSQPGNPGVILIHFQADPQFLTRSGVVLNTP
jgi:hypothetical protein